MEPTVHTMNNLFEQLGLPSSSEAVEAFIASHAPLASAVKLPEAPFWTSAQAAFLEAEILEDADWAEIIDQLDARLRG
ncbi:MAG: DUF2789 domain-containing protein [Zoogloeaceae bacterium]|nr:DUF2789 domain-containing protein [Zoogloeaceae bacterium]